MTVPRFDFDRHTPDYRDKFVDITHQMHRSRPLAWTQTYGGHWVVQIEEAV